jgi:predicted dinucleotide-binding enzyme
MNIAILGAGNVGSALARLWAGQGHTVTFGLKPGSNPRNPMPAGVSAAAIPDAVAAAAVVTLCVPWPAAEAAVRSAGPLAGKVLIDATNPLKDDLSGLELGTTTSAAEQVAAWAGRTRVVKAFNTIGAMLYGNADIAGMRADGFYCGDDADAKREVATLITDAGLDPIDVGPLRMARALEPMALLWIDLAVRQKRPLPFGFKLLRG